MNSKSVGATGNGGGGAEDYILIRDEKSQGTNGGTFTAGAWQTRDLNTEVEDTGGDATLSSNQITLQPGTYSCCISAPALRVGSHQLRLRNISESSDILPGSSEFSHQTLDLTQTRSFIVGRFTLAVSKIIEVQHRCTTTLATNGFGNAGNFTTEVYTIAQFWKEA